MLSEQELKEIESKMLGPHGRDYSYSGANTLLAHIRAQDEALEQKDAELEHVRRALEWIKQQGNSDTDGHPKRYAYQTASFFNIPDFAVQNIWVSFDLI